MRNSLLAAILLFVTTHTALSQTWDLTNSGTNDWLCIASSADGNTLIAGQWGGAVEVSTNAGVTWTTNLTINGDWASVASSADGTTLLAAANPGGVYLSTNSGATWSANGLPVMGWSSVAMSTDGKIIVAAATENSDFSIGGSVFCSTNSGATWTSNSVSFACGVAMSADGRKIFVTGPLQLSYSTNFGTSWMVMSNAPPSYGFTSPSQYIASSTDGNKLVMSVSTADGAPYFLYTSADSGNSWNLTSAPGGTWTRVASSADGKTLMAAGDPFSAPSPLCISTNSGASWTTNTSEIWAGVACSADGGALVAVGYANFDPYSATIFRSQYSEPSTSQTWNLTNAGTNDWECIASSADGNTLIAGQWPGCLGVSTNGGTTWTTNVMTNGNWFSVAASADGTKLLAAAANVGRSPTVGVYVSTNSGASWISNNLPELYWSSVAISADGKTMAAVAPIVSTPAFASVSAVFCSTNSGMNWVSNNIDLISSVDPPEAVGVAMSADGRKIFALAPLELCYSTNFGASWMVMTNPPPIDGYGVPSQAIASSADGNKLIVCSPGGGVYISTNSGSTWGLTSIPKNNWSFVASSADGRTLMVGGIGLSQPCPLCISTNSGASWTFNTNENWAGVACSADGGALAAVAGSDTNFDANSGAIYRSQFIQPPLMSAIRSSNGLFVSWIIPSTNFMLEQSGDLDNWSAVTNAPVLNMANLEEQVLISATNGSGFYRLVH